LRPLPEQPASQQLPLFDFLQKLWHYREGMVYLSPAPLYHSAPQAAVNLTIRNGGTVVIMESFDPERYLELVEQWGITHTQLVPTMFSRMLKCRRDAQRQRPVHARNRDPRRGALPRGVKEDDQMGADHPRILRRTEAARLRLATARAMAGPSRHRRKGAARDTAYPRREHAAEPKGAPGTVWFKTGDAVRIFRRSAKTRSRARRRQHEHRRRTSVMSTMTASVLNHPCRRSFGSAACFVEDMQVAEQHPCRRCRDGQPLLAVRKR